jgi:diphosphomevalonate decarboxylase
MDYNNPNGIVHSADIESGSIRWKSPSNIALIKYWGKYGKQLPRNPSISLTLDAAYTETVLDYRPREKQGSGVDLRFFFEGQEKPEFAARIEKYLNTVLPVFPFLKQLSLDIRSHNSFPHSSGIASSASSMSALALCLCSLEERLLKKDLDNEAFERKASFVARIGSGSASRSIFSTAALWGKMNEYEGSAEECAVPLKDVLHKNFKDFKDWIFIVSREKKSVSSSLGHDLMNNHDFAEARYAQARRKAHFLLEHLRHGHIEEAGKIIEEEALTLHGLMMCSQPGFILMEPRTIDLIRAIQAFRESTGVQAYFTLDAGPNVHLLYPEKDEELIEQFVREKFPEFFEPGRSIRDRIGNGPVQLD